MAQNHSTRRNRALLAVGVWGVLTGVFLACSMDGKVRAGLRSSGDTDLPRLRPAESLLLDQAAKKITIEEGVLIAESLQSDVFFIMPNPDGVEFSGFRIGFGSAQGLTSTRDDEPAELPDGIWYFPRGGVFSDASGDFLIPNDGVVLAGNILSDAVAHQLAGAGGSVTCGDGYYACCGKNQHGQWRAKCIQNGANPPGGTNYPTSCTNGGTGSTQCANGTASMLMIENFDIIDREQRIIR